MVNKVQQLAAAGEKPSEDREVERLAHLQHLVSHLGHLLPAQGPITVFVHHNTLHAFEDLPFDAAVQKGARVFGCQTYLSEERYRADLERGRITKADLAAVLRQELGDDSSESVAGLCTRGELRAAMLEYPLRMAPVPELRWFIAETDALTKYRADAPTAVRDRFLEATQHWVMRDLRGSEASRKERRVHDALEGLLDHFGRSKVEQWTPAVWEAFSLQALWRACRDGVHGLKVHQAANASPFIRHRDILLQATGEDSDRLVHDLLIRFCAAFLDQGFASWPLPNRDRGFFDSFCELYRQPFGAPDHWLRGLPHELARLQEAGMDAVDSILESLELLGVSESEWEEYLTGTLLALRGWAGMIRQMETRADRAAQPAPPGTLIGFLAIRLVLDRLALVEVAHDTLGFTGSLDSLRSIARGKVHKQAAINVDQRAFMLFQLAQVLDWSPPKLYALTKQQWSSVLGEVEAFGSLERRRIFQLAFERQYAVRTLDAIALASGRHGARTTRPEFQAVFCLDEREESFRRHLEEIAPGIETFGAAGFYSVAMYYRGAADAHFAPLCPVVIRPQHWVTEDVVYSWEDMHRRRAKTRRVLGTVSHLLHTSSRSITGGALLTASLGVFATIPLVARILFPRLTSRVRRSAGRLVEPPLSTRLVLERPATVQPGPDDGSQGFTVAEMANIAERQLRDLGLTKNFSRLVIIVGHGSDSVNNPHNSAYNCGACGGRPGAANARALARMLNDVRVREILGERGLDVPEDTMFVGGYHDTCNESVRFADLDLLPKSHKADFERAQQVFEAALDRNAHERCRRFQSAPLSLSAPAARRHVEGRAEDLAQTRPELGHATNAVCYVGRRQRTLGLFMDRRTFLTSYDPTQDDAEHAILTRILSAAMPVCAGINLEYYFSYMDPVGWGCGTKLPHNVTALLGIMDGAVSDLRPGLPWQMVEIHEPVRILFVVENTPEAMTRIMDRNPALGQLCRNRWIQLAVLSPQSSEMHYFDGQRFTPYDPQSKELPKAPCSADWYRGWRGHLGYALVESQAS